jgi:hypothetical protein
MARYLKQTKNYILKLYFPKIKQNEVTLDLLRFGQEPDLLLDLIVSKSDGKSFLIDEKNTLMDLDDTLAYISNRETSTIIF